MNSHCARWIKGLGFLFQALLILPAQATCVGSSDEVIFEAEILACEAVRPRVEKAVAQECSDALAADLGFDLPEAVLPDLSPRRRSLAVSFPRGQSSLSMVESQSERMRQQAGDVVIVTTRTLRYEIYPRGAAPVGNWQMSKYRESIERLLELPASACPDLVGKRLIFDDESPCCDFEPTSDLACYLRLGRLRLTMPLAASSEPAQEDATPDR